MFLINSRQGFFSCGPPSEEFGQALSLTYGRCFAEFLEDLSLVRLGLLDLTTCVGLRYGLYNNKFRDFSWKRAPQNLPWQITKTFMLRSDLCIPDLPRIRPHDTNGNPIIRSEYNPPSSHRLLYKSWNINHVSIGYGFRHLLRPD